jgi:hypothetical protein
MPVLVGILAKAKHYLTTQANQIDDPAMRQHYLNDIAENRQIQALGDQSKKKLT